MKSEEQKKLMKRQYNLGFWSALIIHGFLQQLIGKDRWLSCEADYWYLSPPWWFYLGLAVLLIYFHHRPLKTLQNK